MHDDHVDREPARGAGDRTPTGPEPLAGACARSLARSRARRAIAARLRARRRRRCWSSSTSALVAVAIAAMAPLAVAHRTAQRDGSRTARAALLSAGSAGEAVAALQRALGVRVTGRYDRGTARAVRAFQRRKGLAVDGIVGPQTRAALGLASRPAAPGAPGAGADVARTLARIAQCESGGDPAAVSPDGRYRGKYQFRRATWRSLGGTGDPAAAPEAEQDRLAAKLLAQRGTAPWPNCA